ncbi:crossover junction endodeoxyribonuclease RuvC [Pseudoglutamicibacter cumminsii]|uniref:crossover junction endodeoxyribonuclease RuvC n=1 Tax=Pseudoglutamicibacter cumminsii TaxID=156979 RepID=UPI0021A89F6C|nr:crossover junction endodeoxyribonuclease RuvC [Pseudoglutamicibacter cumminsii]MCT1685507.1 crossover junction endodeoxyribonuclease RuvC [Pseudoglutamicibacter cumminsii]
MRVAGVDPGLTRCGLALVSVGADRTATLEDVRVIGSPSEVPLDQRLLTISERIDAWLDEFRPDALAIERVFTYTNVSTVMGTAQAMGVIIAAAARRGIPVALHTPTEVKAAVTGSGQADKQQVGRMVTKILRLAAAPKPADAADAIAIALAHGWRGADPASKAAASASSQSGVAPAQRAWLKAQAQAANNSARAEAALRVRARKPRGL